MPSSAPSRFRLLAQALVGVLSLGLAELIARSLGLELAAGVLCRCIKIQHRLVYQVLKGDRIVKVLRLWSHDESSQGEHQAR